MLAQKAGLQPAAPPPTPAEPRYARRPLRALIVEDSIDDFELIVAILARAGWSVEAERVDQPAQMRAALVARGCDVVIADYSLPRFTGAEALLLAKDSDIDAPFILVSGSIGEDAAVAALHAGADDCISKTNLSRLAHAVKRSLAAAEARRARQRAEAALRESLEQVRALSAHMDKSIEAERAGFARDLHDQVGGTLTALRSELDVLRQRVEDPALARRVQSMDSLVESAMNATISMARALRPGILDHGVYPALEWQAHEFEERTGTACRVTCNDKEAMLDIEQSTALYRVFHEALTNVSKHAGASRVDAELFINASTVTLEVRDNGTGLEQGALGKRASFGIRGMMERVRALGGWLDISGQSGEGATMMLSIPRRRPKAGRGGE
ncbi:MAG: ATP-binding response regulator [Betaproteobacteria bacterium]